MWISVTIIGYNTVGFANSVTNKMEKTGIQINYLVYDNSIIVYWHILVGNFSEEKFSKWIKIQPEAHDYNKFGFTFAKLSPTCYTVVM